LYGSVAVNRLAQWICPDATNPFKPAKLKNRAATLTKSADKISYVTPDGRTIVDVDALLRDPKVQETIQKLSQRNRSYRGRPGITFLKPVKNSG